MVVPGRKLRKARAEGFPFCPPPEPRAIRCSPWTPASPPTAGLHRDRATRAYASLVQHGSRAGAPGIRRQGSTWPGGAAWSALAFLVGQLMGTRSLPQYDPGQAGQGEQILHQPGCGYCRRPRASSSSGAGLLPPTFTFGPIDPPQMQQAARQVAAALHALPAAAQDIRSPGPVEISSKIAGDPPRQSLPAAWAAVPPASSRSAVAARAGHVQGSGATCRRGRHRRRRPGGRRQRAGRPSGPDCR